MGRDLRRAVETSLNKRLQDNPRITGCVENLSKWGDGYGGVKVILWYPHRNGQDEHREVSSDNIRVVKIARLKTKEINTLATIVQQVADDFPDQEVKLHGSRNGAFTYHFTRKKS